MKLAIIGDPSRKEQDIVLWEKAKEIYGSALYVPIDELMIETGEGCKLKYKGTDLCEFDSVLPVPTARYKELFAAVIEVLANKKIYLPYTFETLSIMKRRALVMSVLRLARFDVPEMHYITSERAVDDILNEIRFPVDVIIGNNSVVAENVKELKKFVKIKSSIPGVYIEEHIKAPEVECLVAGNEVVATVAKKGRKVVGVNVGSEQMKVAVDAVKQFGSVYGSVIFRGNKIVNVSLSPRFADIGKATAKDTTRALLEHLKTNVAERRESVLEKMIKLARR
ncbi:MAG: hypothetical protein ABIG30_03115 [Candidatus Aenigmatarchaeota archaeon]